MYFAAVETFEDDIFTIFLIIKQLIPVLTFK